MSGYTKLFSSILHSTVWLADGPTRLVWITMLALTDRDGTVEASVPGLAKAAGVTREECDRALAFFTAPDPDSRTKDHEGRRIAAIDGGWRLLNHAKYRERASAEEVREKNAERKRAERERDAERKKAEAAEGVRSNESLVDLLVAEAMTPEFAEEVTATPSAVTLCHAASRGVAARPVPSLHTDPSPSPAPSQNESESARGVTEIFPARPPNAPPPRGSPKSLSLFQPGPDGTRLPEYIRRGVVSDFRRMKTPPPKEANDPLAPEWTAIAKWVAEKAALLDRDERLTAEHLVICFVQSSAAKREGFPISFLAKNPTQYWRDNLSEVA